jgi:hypothetical protein
MVVDTLRFRMFVVEKRQEVAAGGHHCGLSFWGEGVGGHQAARLAVADVEVRRPAVSQSKRSRLI